MSNEILEFWNERAKLDAISGSNDFIAKKIEQKEIISLISDGSTIAEFGCGNGETAILIAENFEKVSINAYDFSEEMINLARKNASEKGIDSIIFDIADINSPPTFNKKFDIIYTERMIINLQTWEEQKNAICFMCDLLSDGGKLILAENSIDGLNEINLFRENCGLETINPPWHNRYIRDSEIEELSRENKIKLIEKRNYTGTYYFISRVINAYDAKQKGVEPRYDADINGLAPLLPSIEKLSQGKVWVIEKANNDNK